MKIKYLTVIVLLVMVLLLLGCGSSVPLKKTSYNFQTEVSELKVKLLSNAPPEKIYPYSSFRMIMDLSNEAAYPITNGKIEIVGLDEKYFKLDRNRETFSSLEGRTALTPLGGQERIEFIGAAGQLFSNSEQYVGNYFLEISYNSKLDFVDTVCLNSNAYDTFDAGCKSNNKKSYAGQGAPLAVASMEEIIYPDTGNGGEVEFRLQIKNKGQGKVQNVTLVNSQLGGNKLVCSFSGKNEEKSLSFSDKQQEGTLICKGTIREGTSYSTTLYLGFVYQYRWEQKQKLNLVK